MNIASLPKVDLHWREDGNPQGPPVVFANSLGTDTRLWDALLPLLPQHLKLIRFDKRGHGLSSNPAGRYTMDELVDDAEQLLDHLHIKSCIFIGLSIGGMIGQSLAAKRPDLIKAMVLSNTAAKMGERLDWNLRIARVESGGMACMSDAILSRWFSAAFLKTSEAIGWRHLLQRTPASGYVACCHALANADLSEQTATLKLPVMGIAGTEDGASPPDVVEATIKLIKHASFHVIEGAGHLPCVEKPDEYAALVCQFIKDTCAPAKVEFMS